MKRRRLLLSGMILGIRLAAFAGTDLPTSETPTAPAVCRNQSILLVAMGNGIRLSAPGRALKDGQTGETIPVLNTATRIPPKGIVRDGWIEILALEDPAP